MLTNMMGEADLLLFLLLAISVSAVSKETTSPAAGYWQDANDLETTTSISPSKRLNSGSDIPVWKLEIQMSPPVKDLFEAVFTSDLFNKFHQCLCQSSTFKCTVELDSSKAGHVQRTDTSSAQEYGDKYECRKEIGAVIGCARFKGLEYKAMCSKRSCAPQLKLFGPGCEQGAVGLLWDTEQLLKISYSHAELAHKILCNFQCGSNDDADDEESSEDGKVSPVVIGIIVACVLIFIIVLAAFTFWFIRQRGCAKETGGHRPSGRARSLDCPVGEFQKQHTHNDPSSFGKQIRQKPSTDNSSPSIAAIRQTREEPTYAYIEESSGMHYTSLDDARKYNHHYEQALPDPKLRPRLALPKLASGQSLHYYSTAIGNEESGQYFEVIADSSLVSQADYVPYVITGQDNYRGQIQKNEDKSNITSYKDWTINSLGKCTRNSK